MNAVYHLDNVSFLERDIKRIFKRLDELYEINAENGQFSIAPNVRYDGTQFSHGVDSQEKFNDLVPEIKSLHTDMYSVIEALYKNNTRKSDDVKDLEAKYPNLRLFRILNNKFKHFNTSAAFDEIRVVHTAVPERSSVEVWIQFVKGQKIDHVLYHQFVVLFVQILWDYKVVSF